MKIFCQRSADIIDPNTDMHYAILSSFQETHFPHYHDFFEFFLVLEGRQKLMVDQHTLILKPGSLALVRPNEVHSRAYVSKGKHINIAFSAEIADAMFRFLGSSFPADRLLSSELPPNITLSQTECDRLHSSMDELYIVSTRDPQQQRMMLRSFLLDIFVRYFSRYASMSESQVHSEPWLETVLREMEYTHNFVEGLPALLTLSGKSHEYLCRTFQKSMGCTPTDYINDLRLNYAANFLIHSDLKIIDICYNAGFNNLSHFYHLFQQKYQKTPNQFRKNEGNKFTRIQAHDESQNLRRSLQ